MIGNVWEDCVEWNTDACRVFLDGTPEGELVRLIPSDSTVRGHKAPPQADGGSGGDGLPPKK
ncbi:MAG: hypothetical protein HY318_20635 [Armatimonadetes bacterium]|nr:hypothetical protein [Armatimonadota bacterium]